MIVKLLTEYHLEFLSLKVDCRGLSESTLVKCHIVGNHMPMPVTRSLSLVRVYNEFGWTILPVGKKTTAKIVFYALS